MKCDTCTTTGRRFRHLLSLQSLSGTAGSDGHIDRSDSSNWTTDNTLKCRFTSKGGREFVSGEQVNAEVTHILETISTTTSRAITTDQRLLLGSRIFQIVAAYDVDEMREIVRIHVKESA